jgi:hypothetical protein
MILSSGTWRHVVLYVDVYRRFGETRCIHLHASSLRVRQHDLRQVGTHLHGVTPEYSDLHCHRCEYLNPHITLQDLRRSQRWL